ncbi:MAG: AMP phosphorylase [archaeon]|nr:AMP phosphorylase [archaeon]
MKLKVKIMRFLAGRPIVILDYKTAIKINVHVGERINIIDHSKNIISVVDTSKGGFLKPDEIAVSNEVVSMLNLRENQLVEVEIAEKPESTLLIRKKMDGHVLEKQEIFKIINDIVNNALTEVEIAYFISAVYKNGMNDDETKNLIEAMVSTGTKLKFSGKVVDKHSIGGIAANRTTPLVVPICASAGLIMPKTSSRAITSAAGTADVIESIARVEFTAPEIERIVHKVGACMVWGGSLGLSPADDKLIQVEKILSLDPKAQLLASVLSKKISVGSKYVIIDIPFGKSAKVNKKEGEKLKKDFEKFGKKFGLKLKCVLTNGEQPIGHGVGPLLEIRDIVKVLQRIEPVPDLEEKALFISGEILELCEKAKKGQGIEMARKILESGRAFTKFTEIIEAQGGRVPKLYEISSRLGKYKHDIIAEFNFKITGIDNKKISHIATLAGSPMDKGAGLYLHKHVGENIERGDKIITLYAESESRLKQALQAYRTLKPIEH